MIRLLGFKRFLPDLHSCKPRFLPLMHPALIFNLLVHFLLNSESFFLNAFVLFALRSIEHCILVASFDLVALSLRYHIVQRGSLEETLTRVLD